MVDHRALRPAGRARRIEDGRGALRVDRRHGRYGPVWQVFDGDGAQAELGHDLGALLVRDDQRGLGVAQDVLRLRRVVVGVHEHDAAARALHAEVGCDPLERVRRVQRHAVAGCDPESAQTAGDLLSLGPQLIPSYVAAAESQHHVAAGRQESVGQRACAQAATKRADVLRHGPTMP